MPAMPLYRSIAAALVLIPLVATFPALAESARGEAEVLDAENIRVEGRLFRLAGIDAPEQGQACSLRERLYDCGMVARTALQDLTAASTVTCQPLNSQDAVAGGTVTARCFSDGYDLSEGMVYTGWAVAVEGLGDRYLKLERDAAEAKRGLWRSGFVKPSDWRAGARLPQEAQ